MKKTRKIFVYALAMSLLVIMCSLFFTATADNNDYDGHWSAQYIEEAKSRGWMNGYPDGKFYPDNDITRAEFSSMLYRALGEPELIGGNYFTDVKSSEWYYTAINALYEQGVVAGYGDEIFAPDDTLTREMGFTMLANAFKLSPDDKNAYKKFSDYTDVSDWAQSPTSALIEKGYVAGIGNNQIAPKRPLTRGEMATLLVKVFDGEQGDQPNEELTTDDFVDYFSFNNDIKEIEQPHTDDNGYIKSGHLKIVLSDIEQYVIEQMQKGHIKNYYIENNTICVTLASGIEYIYIPRLEGLDSAPISRKIVTNQPFDTDYSQRIRDISVCVDESANKISRLVEDDYIYSYIDNNDNTDDDFNDDEVTLDELKSLSDFSVILWHGHGGYDSKHHSYLLTGETFNEEKFWWDPSYFIKFSDDLLNGRIVGCGDTLAVTHKFFERHLGDMDGAFVYLGACSSGKDDVLANSFIEKGASTIFANSDTIHTEYNLAMLREVIASMTTINVNGKYNTASEALSIAQSINGEVDIIDEDDIHIETMVRILGNHDYRFSESKISTDFPGGDGTEENPYKVSTAEQLNAVRNDLSAHYIQVNDIDLSGYSNWAPIGGSANNFTGSYDGQNHSISNLIIDSTEYASNGLFGAINNAIIKNIVINNVSAKVATSGTIGSLVGYSYSSSIRNCDVNDVTININGYASHIGGLIGSNSSSIVQNCGASSIKISINSSTSGMVGGLIGQNNNLDMVTNNTVDNVNIQGSSWCNIGALIGRSIRATIKNNLVKGKVILNTNYSSGCLVGYNDSCIIEENTINGEITISDVYTYGGGFVGINYHTASKIANNILVGKITIAGKYNSEVGGFVGSNGSGSSSGGIIENNYIYGNINLNGSSRYMGGLAGYNKNAITGNNIEGDVFITCSGGSSSSSSWCGGFVGYNDNLLSSLTNNTVNGNITVVGSGWSQDNALIGNSGGIINNNIVAGIITINGQKTS